MWFPKFLNRSRPQSRSRGVPPARRKPLTTRLFLEPLEDRTLPSSGWAITNTGPATFGTFQRISSPDPAGDYYVTGSLTGTATLGTTTLNAPNGASYVAKVDPNGNYLWATLLGNGPAVNASAITVDNSGNVYAAGSFSGTVTFGPFTRTANGSVAPWLVDGYVCKLDSNGNVLWVQTMGGPVDDAVTSITTDPNGNVCVTGLFNSGSGSGNVSATFGTTTLTTPYGGNAFLSKLDSNGNFLWSEQLVPGNTAATPHGIAADSNGNTYVSGGGFVDRVDPNGNVIWTQGTNFGAYGNDAIYQDPVTGATSLYIGGFSGAIQKLDAATGTTLWAKNLGTTASYSAVIGAIAVDASGNVYCEGSYPAGSDLDPGAGTAILDSSSGTFLAKFDAAGNFLSLRDVFVNGGQSNRNMSLALDASGNIYTAGSFQTTATCDTGSQIVQLTGSGNTSLFIVKTTQDTGMIFGRVFDDINNNGVPDPGEGGIPGVQVYLDLNNSGSYVAGDPTATTDSQGYYHFTDVTPGSYTVRQTLPTGYTSSPASFTVSVSAGQASELGNFADHTPNKTTTYSTSPAIKTSKGKPNAVSTLTVPNSDTSTVLGLTLSLTVSNPSGNSLSIFLTGPNGTKVEVGTTNQNGTLTYQVSAFDYMLVKGPWTLEVDGLSGGTLTKWSLNVTETA